MGNLVFSRYFSICVTFILVMIGSFSIWKIPVMMFPDLQSSVITIETSWSSASPQDVEKHVVQPQERVLKSIAGLKRIESNIYAGSGTVSLQFDYDADVGRALTDVVAQLAQIPSFPIDAERPTVTLQGSSQGAKVLTYFLVPSKDADLTKLTPMARKKILDRAVVPALEGVKGVSLIETLGVPNGEVIIEVDPLKLADAGMNISTIANKLSNIDDFTAGYFRQGRHYMSVRYVNNKDVDKLSQLVLGEAGNNLIRLADVAKVSVRAEELPYRMTQNDREAMLISVFAKTGEDVLKVITRTNQMVEQLNRDLAEQQVELVSSLNVGVFLERSIKNLLMNLAVAFLCISIVVWIMMKSPLTVIQSFVSIILAVLVSVTILALFDRSLNIISLAGMAVAFGLVVDNSVLISEKLMEKRQLGMSLFDAQWLAVKEAWRPLFVSTITSTIVFLPFFMATDVEGQILKDISLSIVASLIGSFFISVLILPGIFEALSRNSESTAKEQPIWGSIADKLNAIGNSAKGKIIIVSTFVGGSILSALNIPQTDFLPAMNYDQVGAGIYTSPSYNLDVWQNETIDEISKRLLPYQTGEKKPKINDYYFYSYRSGSSLGIRMADRDDVSEILDLLNNEITAGFSDVAAYSYRNSIFSDFGLDRAIKLDIYADDVNHVLDVIGKNRDLFDQAFSDAYIYEEPSKGAIDTQLIITPNDHNILLSDLDPAEVEKYVTTFSSGYYVRELYSQNERLRVFIRGEQSRKTFEPSEIFMLNNDDVIIPLETVVDTHTETTLTNVRRVNGFRAVTVNIVPSKAMSVEQAMEIFDRDIRPKLQAELNPSDVIHASGDAEKLGNVTRLLSNGYLISLLFLFLLLVIIYQSVSKGIGIIICLPYAIMGGILAMHITNLFTAQSMDMLTMLAFVILSGLAVNNIVVILAETEHNLARKMPLNDAINQAVKLRLRVVVVSNVTTILALLPMLFSSGEGAGLYRGFAAVMVGGIMFSTPMTLLSAPLIVQRCLGSRSSQRTNPTEEI